MCGGAAFVSFFERNVSQQPPQESQRFSVLRWCFFPRRANKKGALLVPILALPACLASRRFPPYLFELIAVSAQTRTKKKKRCLQMVCPFCILASHAYEMPHRTNLYQRITRLAKHIRGQKETTNGTSRRFLCSLKRFPS